MSGKLFYRDRPVFGLEIGQTGLHAMSLTKKRKVLGYGNVDLDPAKLEESLIAKNDYLSDGIKDLLDNKIIGRISSSRVVLSAPTARTFTRSLTLPVSAEENLLEAVQLESEQYIPVPISELYMDFSVIARTKGTIEVMMCAVPKQLVDALVTACQKAHLQPVLVEPAILSLARLIHITEEGHLPTIIIDIGAASSDIAILDKNIRVTGGAPVGGHTFTLAISKQLNLSLDEAHQLKVRSGLGIGAKQENIHQAVKPQLDKIITEVRKVIRYYTERIGATSKVEQVVIVGNGSNMAGIGDYFTETLVMPARIGSPWQLMDFGKLAEPSHTLRARYMTASGDLEMINLLAPEMKRQIRAARVNVVLLNYCLLLGATAIALIAIFGAGTWLTMQERTQAIDQKSQNDQLATQYAKTKQQADSFANDLKQAKTILGGEISFYNLIIKIATVVPEGVILSNLSLGTNTLTAPININAKARNYDDAVKLKNALAESPIFETVTLSNATSGTVDAESDPIGARYPITITLSATFSKDFAKQLGAKP
jgi:type IV pilus assembly protein PilM